MDGAGKVRVVIRPDNSGAAVARILCRNIDDGIVRYDSRLGIFDRGVGVFFGALFAAKVITAHKHLATARLARCINFACNRYLIGFQANCATRCAGGFTRCLDLTTRQNRRIAALRRDDDFAVVFGDGGCR